MFSIDFRQRERERETERSIDVREMLVRGPPHAPAQGSSPQPFGLRMALHQLGQPARAFQIVFNEQMLLLAFKKYIKK